MFIRKLASFFQSTSSGVDCVCGGGRAAVHALRDRLKLSSWLHWRWRCSRFIWRSCWRHWRWRCPRFIWRSCWRHWRWRCPSFIWCRSLSCWRWRSWSQLSLSCCLRNDGRGDAAFYVSKCLANPLFHRFGNRSRCRQRNGGYVCWLWLKRNWHVLFVNFS